MQKAFLELSFRLGQLVLCLSVTPPIATATGLGFHASSSFGLIRGLTWSLPPHGPYRLGLHSPPSSSPKTALPQIGPPSWLELIPPWLNSINPWSPTYLLSPPCPLLTWSPLVYLKPTHARLFTAWSPTHHSPSCCHCHRTGLQCLF